MTKNECPTINRVKKTNFCHEFAKFANISQDRAKSKKLLIMKHFLKNCYFDYTIQTASSLTIESLNRFAVFMSGMQVLNSKN